MWIFPNTNNVFEIWRNTDWNCTYNFRTDTEFKQKGVLVKVGSTWTPKWIEVRGHIFPELKVCSNVEMSQGCCWLQSRTWREQGNTNVTEPQRQAAPDCRVFCLRTLLYCFHSAGNYPIVGLCSNLYLNMAVVYK